MMVAGKLTKSGRWWAAEVPLLGIYTQGATRAKAYAMVKDAIEVLADRPSLVEVVGTRGDMFAVRGLTDEWAAFILRRIRESRGMSLEDARRAIGATSRNAYARYEKGQAVPAANRLVELIERMMPAGEVVLDYVAKAP